MTRPRRYGITPLTPASDLDTFAQQVQEAFDQYALAGDDRQALANWDQRYSLVMAQNAVVLSDQAAQEQERRVQRRRTLIDRFIYSGISVLLVIGGAFGIRTMKQDQARSEAATAATIAAREDCYSALYLQHHVTLVEGKVIDLLSDDEAGWLPPYQGNNSSQFGNIAQTPTDLVANKPSTGEVVREAETMKTWETTDGNRTFRDPRSVLLERHGNTLMLTFIWDDKNPMSINHEPLSKNKHNPSAPTASVQVRAEKVSNTCFVDR